MEFYPERNKNSELSGETEHGWMKSPALRILIFLAVVLYMGNLGAIVDSVLHSDIEYFDEGHLIVGGLTAFMMALLFGVLMLYAGWLEKIVKSHRNVERLALESEKKYREIFEQSKDAIFISTPEGFFTEINPAGVKMFGYNSREEMLHIKTSDLYSSEAERESIRQTLEKQGFFKDYEFNMRKKDGSEIEVSASVEIARDEAGNVIAYHGALRDVSLKKRFDQQQLQGQKMESIGRLAGGVAHDFNNYLTTIQGYTDLAIMSLPGDGPLKENLEEVRKASMGAAELTAQLLLFSRHQAMEMRPVNLNRLVGSLKSMIQRLVGENARIVDNLSDDLQEVTGDIGNLSQVLANLVLNASSNMANGGEITIITCNAAVTEDYVKTHPEARTGKFVTLSVTDTGKGLDSEAMAHVFEPFYRASAERNGEVGLGLSAVYGIVMQHDGWIDVDSTPGMGTTFTIFMPAVAQLEESGSADAGEDDRKKSAGERILLVEDDDSVREITEKILRQSGYVVVSAHDAAEAFARFASEKGDFQLVFSDIVLPGDDGVTLVGNLKSHKPELAVLLSSGYSDTAVDWQAVQARGYRFMQKPYVMPELLKTIRELLSNSS